MANNKMPSGMQKVIDTLDVWCNDELDTENHIRPWRVLKPHREDDGDCKDFTLTIAYRMHGKSVISMLKNHGKTWHMPYVEITDARYERGVYHTFYTNPEMTWCLDNDLKFRELEVDQNSGVFKTFAEMRMLRFYETWYIAYRLGRTAIWDILTARTKYHPVRKAFRVLLRATIGSEGNWK